MQLPRGCQAAVAAMSESGSEPSDPLWTRSWLALPLAAGALFVCLAGHAAWLETPTIDEFAHVPAGFAYLDGGPLEHYAKNPPLMQALLALPGTLWGGVSVPEPGLLSQSWGPWIYGGEFMRANAEAYFEIFALARWVVILNWTRGRPSSFGQMEGVYDTDHIFIYPPGSVESGQQDNERYSFSKATPESCQWDAQRTADGGENWEMYWIMEFTRRGPAINIQRIVGTYIFSADSSANRLREIFQLFVDFDVDLVTVASGDHADFGKPTNRLQ